jgi:hypothetical protein
VAVGVLLRFRQVNGRDAAAHLLRDQILATRHIV